MTKKIVFGAALALVIVGLAAPSASAACNPPRTASSFGVANTYFVPSPSLDPPATSLLGRIWSGTLDHTGACNTLTPGGSPWFYFYGPGIGFRQDLGDACVVGCPSATLSLEVVASNGTDSETLTSKAPYDPTAGTQYDFSTAALANQTMSNIRPRSTASSRSGSNVNLTIAINAVSAFGGSGANITGYNIRSASSPTDPGGLAIAYPTLITTIPAPGGTAQTANIVVDCSNIANDTWVATQLVYDTSGGSNLVSGRTRVKCNPALANPKFNVIPKKSMPTGTRN